MEEGNNSGGRNNYVNETGASLPKIPVMRGKDVIRESVVKGNVTTVLGNVSHWAEYIRESATALERVIEIARTSLQQQNYPEGVPAEQISLVPNPALFVNLLKAPEFQQVMAVLIVQFLKE
ncbi:MAG: hypothetical protein QHH75_11000 [Bacillota bacterium]|nr:hypothetical protein [Bacillota bacterium]